MIHPPPLTNLCIYYTTPTDNTQQAKEQNLLRKFRKRQDHVLKSRSVIEHDAPRRRHHGDYGREAIKSKGLSSIDRRQLNREIDGSAVRSLPHEGQTLQILVRRIPRIDRRGKIVKFPHNPFRRRRAGDAQMMCARLQDGRCAGNLGGLDMIQNLELLQIVENGGLATAVFYICSSVSVFG